MDKLNMEIDDELKQDFMESIIDYHESVARCIMHLDHDPDNGEIINEVYRAMHSIKGNAGICHFNNLADLCHEIENVLSAMRSNTLRYTRLLGETLMVLMDMIKEISEDILVGNEFDHKLAEEIKHLLCAIAESTEDEIPSHAIKIITLLTGTIVDDEIDVESFANLEEQDSELTPDSTETNPTAFAELALFRYLSYQLECKFPYWENRTERILPLVRKINNLQNQPVDPDQLDAAVYMHDTAQAFISDQIILKAGRYTDEEIQQMKVHVQTGADIMRIIPGWDDATTIIEQHHERWDGNGYPMGLKENDICTGAQIIAVVDAYESMTHQRADRQYKRSILRAVTEINNCSGTQFSPEIVLLFNEVLRSQLKAKNKNAPA